MPLCRSSGEKLRVAYGRGELEPLIQNVLFPNESLEIKLPNRVVARGTGTGPSYAFNVHQDYGLTPEEYAQHATANTPTQNTSARSIAEAVRKADAFTVLCFWRVTNMKWPLRDCPLAVCDSSSITFDDMVPTQLYGVTSSGSPVPSLSLKYSPQQRWFSYPDMTNDEVLVFKHFEWDKNKNNSENNHRKTYRCCFHTAFHDPRAHAEKRQSVEYRVAVFRTGPKADA